VSITNTNIYVTSQSITTTTTTAKLLIMAHFTATSVAASQFYGTIARSTASPIASNSTNLSNNASMTIAINTVPSHMGSVYISASGQTESIAITVVDTPGSAGTYYYSIWCYNSGGTITTENVMLTILQVLI
jgi:hypothetical protein